MTDQGDWGASLRIFLTVEAGKWPSERDLKTMIRNCCLACSQEISVKIVPGAELSAVFVDDDRMRALNKDWRDLDKSTNVLSFPASDPSGDPFGPLLGDIVFAHETVQRETKELAIPFENHLCHLIVHGILHLFGYDHISDEEAVDMERTETHILKRMDIPNPYATASV